MKTLEELREEIDEIDTELHELLTRRIKIGQEVAKAKKVNSGFNLRPGREAQILRKLISRNTPPLSANSIYRIWSEILSANLNQETQINAAAYLPSRDYHDLAQDYCGSSSKIIEFSIFQEVLDEIRLISKKLSNPYFIDIGSSDGYYPIGFLKKNIFKYCFSFESGEKERKLIEKNASSNNVIDRISNNGYFHGLLSQKIERKILENSVILMDIAGGEFQIITEEFLQDIKNSFLIIELHDHYFKDGEEKLNTLKNRINKFFVQKEIKTSQRDLSIFSELSDIPDSDRWLMCSEGRRVQGHWLVLYPKRNL